MLYVPIAEKSLIAGMFILQAEKYGITRISARLKFQKAILKNA
jgi:hypothetical protein